MLRESIIEKICNFLKGVLFDLLNKALEVGIISLVETALMLADGGLKFVSSGGKKFVKFV